MDNTGKGRFSGHRAGFSFVEIVVVVVILSIAAFLTVPMIGSAATMQVRSAANVIAADMEYTKSLAISRGQNFTVEFNVSDNSYQILDHTGQVIKHPIHRDRDYKVRFGGDDRLSRVGIDSANFDNTAKVTFSYLGSPFNGSAVPLTAGQVVVSAENASMRIVVEPVTGFISVKD